MRDDALGVSPESFRQMFAVALAAQATGRRMGLSQAGCDVSYLQLNASAPFFKEQYGMLLSAIATGKPVDINTGTACGNNLIVDWLLMHE